VPVLAPGLGRTKTGRIWTYVRDDRPFGGTAPAGVLYRYTPDRKGEHPRGHLAGFTGILQADGYAGFAQLYTGNRISEAACLAHARRKFFDLFEVTKSPLARRRWRRSRLSTASRQRSAASPRITGCGSGGNGAHRCSRT
jgi:transposase